MNYQIAIAIAQPSGEAAARNSGRLLEAFDRTHPEAGAAIGANRIECTLDVTFSLDADHVRDAFERAWRLFGIAVQATKLAAPLLIERFEIVTVVPSSGAGFPRA
jgi:hypothetical protein